jgi:hypothetical protein
MHLLAPALKSFLIVGWIDATLHNVAGFMFIIHAAALVGYLVLYTTL